MAWHERVFDGLYDRFTFPLFSDEGNEAEARFLEESLHLKHGEEILDLACGHGRHASLLAKEGFSITGVDTNERYLDMARQKDPASRYICADLRELTFDESFDAAYCFFSSFGYFDDSTNANVLRRIAAALKPGGRLLIDLQNRELYTTGEPNYQEFVELTIDEQPAALLMTTSFDVGSSRVTIKQRLYHRGEVETMRFSMRLYTLAELNWLLESVGLAIVKAHGDIDASGYQLDSERLIVVARKGR